MRRQRRCPEARAASCPQAGSTARTDTMTERPKKASRKFSECPALRPSACLTSQLLSASALYGSVSFLFLFQSMSASLRRSLLLGSHVTISPSLWASVSLSLSGRFGSPSLCCCVSVSPYPDPVSPLICGSREPGKTAAHSISTPGPHGVSAGESLG